MKKLVALFLAAALTLSLVACGGGGSSSAAPAGSGSTAGSSAAASTPKEPLNVALLYGGTLGAQAFIDVVDKGFKQAAADFGINYSVLENVELSAAADTFRGAGRGGGRESRFPVRASGCGRHRRAVLCAPQYL